MKILILYQDIPGGTKNATEAIITSLKKNYPQHTFYIYKQKDKLFSGPLQYTRHLLWSVWDFYRVLTSFKNKKLDVVYFTIYSAILFRPILTSSIKKTKFFFHFHGNQEFVDELEIESQRSWLGKQYKYLLGKLVNNLQKYALHQSNIVCFVSTEAKNIFIKKHDLDDINHKIRVIPNGVDTKTFFPAENKKTVRALKSKILQTTHKVILFAGRIDEKKGITQLIKAFSLLLKKHPKCLLVIAHPPLREKQSFSYYEKISELINHLHLTKKIVLIDSYEPIRHLYWIADTVVLPSEREYCSLVLLEAFACGIPFIGSDVGFAPEFLTKVNKKLITSGNAPAALLKALDWFFSLNSVQRQAISKTGKKEVATFTWDHVSQSIIGNFN